MSSRYRSNSLSPRALYATFCAALALAVLVPAALAHAAPKVGAVVYSQTYRSSTGVEEGGLYAIKDGHLNQLTEDPGDEEPSFSPDGRTIAFVREGDLFSVRPDGSGQRRLTRGPAFDSAPRISPNGHAVVFERRNEENGTADLWTVSATGGGLHHLTHGAEDDKEAIFSPEGKTIVFVRATGGKGNAATEDLYSIRPTGAGLARLTTTARTDEFAPRYFAGGIVFSRGQDSETPAAFADIYTMRRNGTKLKPLVRGVGSAYVEDVSPQGHTLIFRRDQGLWIKRIGPPKGTKLTQLPDGSQTNSVFSSDGRSVATMIEVEGSERLVAINIASGDRSDLVEGYEGETGESALKIGTVIDWQPVR